MTGPHASGGDATRAGLTAVVPFMAPGMTERALQIEIEAEFFRHGADTVAYDSIIASGPNAAVLHHLPTQRPLRAGELVLIDAGAECRGYDCDVTRTYPVSGDFSAEQADVYALVLQAQRAAIGRCCAGVEYRDIHLAAALDLAQGLQRGVDGRDSEGVNVTGRQDMQAMTRSGYEQSRTHVFTNTL